MRKTILLLALLLPIFSLTFVSCDDDDDDNEYTPLWYSYSTLIKDNSAMGHYYDLDSGGTLVPENALDLSDFEDTTRVVVTYTISSETGADDNKEVVGDIKLVREILTKDIFQLTESNVDSVGNDPVYLNEDNIWTSDNHLNIIFTYYGFNQSHYINLCKPVGTQTDADGNQILELRHNTNGDYQYYSYNSDVSFDMRSIKESGMDSINFVLKAIEGDTNNFVYYGTFHFNDIEESASKAIPSQQISSPLTIE